MAGQLTGLHAKFTGDSTSLRNAAKLAQLELNKLQAKTAEAKRDADAYAASSEGLANSFRKLKMETDSAYAGMTRYQKAAELVNKVAIDQKWSQEQLGAELQRLAVHYGVAERAGFDMNDQIRSARFHTANMAAQFQDVFVMMSSGQNPLLLGIQQGSQMTQVLQAAGGSIKASGKLLLESFKLLISPVTLLTVGLAAGVAALGQWIYSATGAAEAEEKLKERTEAHKEAVDNLTAAIKRNNDEVLISLGVAGSSEELAAKQELMLLQQEQNKLLAEQAALQATVTNKASGPQLAVQAALLQQQIDKNQAQQDELDKLIATRQAQDALYAATAQYRAQAKAAWEAVLAKMAASLERQDQIAQRARLAKDQFHLMAGESSAVQSSLAAGANSAEDIANAKMAYAISQAAGWAKTLWDRLSGAAASARAIAANPALAAPGTKDNLRWQYAQYGAGRVAATDATNPLYNPNGPKDSGGGGGGGGTNYDSELEQLRTSLMNQEQLEMQSYEKRLELLKNALNEKLITQKEYAGLMEQVEAAHGFAMTQQTNRNTTMVLGALGQLFQGSKKIGAAIALANSYVAFTEVLKDPAYVGRPWARFAAAASALSSGLAAVRSIKAAQPGGTTSGGGSPGSGGGAASGPQTSTNVSLQLLGGDLFSRAQVIKLINAINDATADGAKILLR